MNIEKSHPGQSIFYVHYFSDCCLDICVMMIILYLFPAAREMATAGFGRGPVSFGWQLY
jgi:hypothetical protein